MTEHWIRHDNNLTLVSIVTDPVYLTEPFIRTTDWMQDPDQNIAPYPCEAVTEVDRPLGAVPNHLPGANPFLHEFSDRWSVPYEATRGGAETMYPEYQKKLKTMPVPPPAKEAIGNHCESQNLLTCGRARMCAGYAQQQQNFDKVEVHVLPVQGNVYMLVGAGGNITLQVGKDGVLLVDTMYAALSDKVVAAIRTVSKGPIRYIINTHAHADHTDGNEKLAKLGATIAGGNVMQLADAAVGAAVIAHENVLNRMSAQKPALPFGMLPTDTYFTKSKDRVL